MPEYKITVYPEVLMELLVEAEDPEDARYKALDMLWSIPITRLIGEYSSCTDTLIDENTVDRAEWTDDKGRDHTFWYKEGFDESRG